MLKSCITKECKNILGRERYDGIYVDFYVVHYHRFFCI